MLSIRGLDPFDQAAVRNRLCRLVGPNIRPEEIFLYPSLFEGDHELVAYIRFKSEQAVNFALKRCSDLGMRASRESMQSFCQSQAVEDPEIQVLEQLHPEGRPLVTSPPMSPSPVMRQVPTQAWEKIARKQGPRPSSSKTRQMLKPKPLTSPGTISPWAASPQPALSPPSRRKAPQEATRCASPFWEVASQRASSPYQRGATIQSGVTPPPAPSKARPASARRTISSATRGPSRYGRPPASSSLPKTSILLEASHTPRGAVNTLLSKGASGQGNASFVRLGSRGNCIDMLSRPETYYERHTETSQATWGRALHQAPWEALSNTSRNFPSKDRLHPPSTGFLIFPGRVEV